MVIRRFESGASNSVYGSFQAKERRQGASYGGSHDIVPHAGQIATSNECRALVTSHSRSPRKTDSWKGRGMVVLGLRLARWSSPALHPRLEKSAASPLSVHKQYCVSSTAAGPFPTAATVQRVAELSAPISSAIPASLSSAVDGISHNWQNSLGQ